MFQRIALLKLAPDNATTDVRSRIRDSLLAEIARGGYDAHVGLPADEAAEKSWDVSLVVTFRTRSQLETFDSAAFLSEFSGVPREIVAVVKGWGFEV